MEANIAESYSRTSRTSTSISKRTRKSSTGKKAPASAQLDQIHQSQNAIQLSMIDSSAFQVFPGETETLWKSGRRAPSSIPHAITGTAYIDVRPDSHHAPPDQTHPIWKTHVLKPEYAQDPTEAGSDLESETIIFDESESDSDHAMDVDDDDFYHTSSSASEVSMMEVDQERAPLREIPKAVRYPVLDREWQEGVPHRVAARFIGTVSLRGIFTRVQDLLIALDLLPASARMACLARPWRTPKPPKRDHHNECDQLRMRVRALRSDERLGAFPTDQCTISTSPCATFIILIACHLSHRQKPRKQQRTRRHHYSRYCAASQIWHLPALLIQRMQHVCPHSFAKHLLYGTPRPLASARQR
jgi:hypothetical protein